MQDFLDRMQHDLVGRLPTREQLDAWCGHIFLAGAERAGLTTNLEDWLEERHVNGRLMQGLRQDVWEAAEDYAWDRGEFSRRLWHLFTAGGTIIDALFGSLWMQANRPVIELGHKLAAAYMTTDVKSLYDLEELPFKALRIRVPKGLVSISNDPLVHVDVFRWMNLHLRIFTEHDNSAVTLKSWSQVQEVLRCPLDTKYNELGHELGPATTTREGKRALKLIFRLVLCVIARMTGFERDATIQKSSGLKKVKGKRKVVDRPTVYRIPDKVTHDFRHFVYEYSNNRGNKITLRSLVTGHWKNQPYGEGRSFRKRIFVEPYWRGPEDGQLAVRPHVLV